MRVYLAGPMRGLPLYNLHAFALGAYRLRYWGYSVFNPMEIDLALHGLNPHQDLDEQGFDIKAAMQRDLEFIASDKCEALAFLPGWRESKGAAHEAIAGLTYDRKLSEFNKDITRLDKIEIVSWDLKIRLEGLDKSGFRCEASP